MELRARIRHFARPAAFTVALTALLVPAVAGPATADAAKRKKKRYPVVTSVRPMNPKVGDTIVIRGRNFKRGKNKNTVVFKRDGARAVFQKETLATAKQIRVVVPDSLRAFLPDYTNARFRLRILSQRFSKKFTTAKKSPTITALPKPVEAKPGSTAAPGATAPKPVTPAPAPPRVCVGDEDHDMLPAKRENELGLDPCNPDSDGDGVLDGYEYQSALDLNDDDYQEGNQSVPYPGKRPYPNPLFKDGDVDYDGDGLPQSSEYRLWDRFGARPAGGVISGPYQLLYSDGEQYSLNHRDPVTGRRKPSQRADTYPNFAKFLDWAHGHGYNPVVVPVASPYYETANQRTFDIRDADHSGSGYLDVDSGPRVGYLHEEKFINDRDGDTWISDDERDEDKDGLTNIDELRGAMTPGYWAKCYQNAKEKPYPVKYEGTDLVNNDTDGDTIRDGADDQDHDDVPNLMELSRNMASGDTDWDAHDGQCTVSDSIPATGPDGPDENTEPDPLEDWHPADYGRVNPFNPCLPYPWSRTCARGADFGTEFAPFDQSTNWFALQ